MIRECLDMQRAREVVSRDERDDAVAGHANEVVVVGGYDLSVTDGEAEASVGRVGDGRAVVSNDQKLLRVGVAGGAAAHHPKTWKPGPDDRYRTPAPPCASSSARVRPETAHCYQAEQSENHARHRHLRVKSRTHAAHW